MHATVEEGFRRELEGNNKIQSFELDTENDEVEVKFSSAATWDRLRIPMEIALKQFMVVDEYETMGSRKCRYSFIPKDDISV